MRSKLGFVAVAVGLMLGMLPAPALAWGAPRTLASTETLGALQGAAAPVRTGFAIEYLGVSWLAGKEPWVRFLVGGEWTRWYEAHEDDVPLADGRTFSHLIGADNAQAYQVKGEASGVRAVAINTTDGPRSLEWEQPTAEASHLGQPPLLSRAEWGADESFRFNEDGTEKWSPAFYGTQKLIVHHTATKNDDPDPAATVRAIYRYHAIDKGWGDIGYNFLVDEQGTIYKGRYSGPAGTWDQDTSTGENADGLGVTAAHVGGYNSGTMGIAVLGTYRGAKQLPDPARRSVVEHLAWESERHDLDPLASSTYVNPVNGTVKENVANISGHRDWASTQCPGDNFYAQIPAIRDEVSAEVSGDGSTTEVSLSAHGYKVKGKQKVDLTWSGAASTSVDVFRNGELLTTTENDGAHTDQLNETGGGSYTYKICEAGTATCSNEAVVTFG